MDFSGLGRCSLEWFCALYLDFMSFLVILVIAAVSAIFSSALAEAKGCNTTSWAVAGFFFGPLALLAIAGMPDKRMQRILLLIAEKQGVVMKPTLNVVETNTAQQYYFTSPLDANFDQLWELAVDAVGVNVAATLARDASYVSARNISMKAPGGQLIAVFNSSRASNKKLAWKGYRVTS
jgi:hypothetical protein